VGNLEVEADDMQGQVEEGGVVTPEVLVARRVPIPDGGVDQELPRVAEERPERVQ